jgi:hypothetical protein
MNNTDVYYDIPIFKSLPTILNDKKNDLKNINLQKIYIEDIYQLEPFENTNKKNLFFLILIFILFFIFFIISFTFIKKY